MRALRNWALPLVPEAWNQKNGIVTLRELRAHRGEKTDDDINENWEKEINLTADRRR